MARRNRKNKNKKSKSNNPSATTNEVVPIRPPNSQKLRVRLNVMLTGTNVTPATTAGYAYLPVTSGLFASASGYAQLAALFLKLKPIKVTTRITFNRATGTTDNPRVAFAPTPDGQPVGNLGMNLSTFESPLACQAVGGPGVTIVQSDPAMIALAVYNTVSNGYQMQRPQALSVRTMPLVYYHDVLFYTPGINLTTVANYVQIYLSFDLEFSCLRTDLNA